MIFSPTDRRVFVNGCISELSLTCTRFAHFSVFYIQMTAEVTTEIGFWSNLQTPVLYYQYFRDLSSTMDPPPLTEFVDWCDNSYLDLNVTKTKEMMSVDFRRQEQSWEDNNEVEIVSKYKHLGTIFDDKLKWDDNTEEIVKKGQQRLIQRKLIILRKLNYFSVDQKILTLFFFTNLLLRVFCHSLSSAGFTAWE